MDYSAKTRRGFTLVEIIISIGILAIILSLGLSVSMDFFRSYSFRSEKNTVVSILQNARSQSLNNIDQVRHGVHFQANPLRYVVFECKLSPPATPCTDYSGADTTKDFSITPSYSSTISGLPFDVIFDQLSGCVSSVGNNCSASTITITGNDNGKTYTITINSEGRIDW
jgi:prepilin-type N-terminal cleavage/methylation domain-containing protein